MAAAHQTTTETSTLQPGERFPLTAHRASGQWCKKVNGRIHYFGKLDDPDAALKRLRAEFDDLKAGRVPRPAEIVTGNVRLAFVCNSFLEHKKRRVESGELAQRTWDELLATCQILTAAFGRDRLVSDLRPSDFDALRSKLAKRFGAVRLTNEIMRVRGVFKFALAEDLIEKPVKFGASFNRPAKRIMRLARSKRTFTAEQCRALLREASDVMQAFVLLGINGGFTSRDCGTLPRAAVDLKAGFIDYARPKTGVHRRVPLWPETIAAMKATMQKRASLAFLTREGTPFSKGEPGHDPLGLAFRRLLVKLGMQKEGLGFATLRHVFQTRAEEGTRDFPAIKVIMRHVDASISERYREGVSDERLRGVVDSVRSWLFADEKRKASTKRKAAVH